MARLIIVLAILAMLVSACDPGETTVDSPATATVDTHDHPDDFNDVVRTGAERAAAAGFSGTYRMQAKVIELRIEGEVTWHRNGDRARADFVGTVDDQDVSLMLIAGPGYPADDLLYACRPVDERCVAARRTVNGDYSADLLPALVPLRLLDTGVFAAGLSFFDEVARPIVDEESLCFIGQTAPPAVGIDNGEVCLTEAGLPLLVTASGAGTTVSLTATDVPGEFEDGAFALPYPLEQE